jgi:pimeloyl-ACP methyl ester carboxylesterase
MAIGCRTVFFVSTLVTAIVIGLLIYVTEFRPSEIPSEIRADHYWGVKEWKLGSVVPADDLTVRPFKIAVEDKVLQDLKQRLANTRIQETIPGVNFEYGFPSWQLRKVVDYWSSTYDWRKEEKKLNQYDHFKTQIEGLDIHFIHVKPKRTNGNKAVPLLLVHGWPGSFVEYMKMIPLLTEGPGVNFELVIPSLPGYGFSEAPQKPGCGLPHVTRIMVKLMKRLGHEKFLFQGGDWGAGVGGMMAGIFPENLIGLHSNFAFVSMGARDFLRLVVADLGFRGLVFEDPVNEVKKMNPISKLFINFLMEWGYSHIQATKPDSVGAGLNDSPVGLAAYILEKFSTWTNSENRGKADGGLLEKFTMDELLTNVMIYWVNGNIASSQRLYKESASALNLNLMIHVPYGVLVGRHELPFSAPKTIIKNRAPNLIQYKDADVGGHFLQMEEPKLVANDIREFYANIVARK